LVFASGTRIGPVSRGGYNGTRLRAGRVSRGVSVYEYPIREAD
jgi:hypothetical protein